MTVRLAEYHDWPIIQALHDASGKPPYPLWERQCDVSGWWMLVEDRQRRPLGCLQIAMSRPQAFLDLLCVPQVFTTRMKWVTIKALLRATFSLLKRMGVKTVLFQADPSYAQWQHIITKHGARYLHSYPTYVIGV